MNRIMRKVLLCALVGICGITAFAAGISEKASGQTVVTPEKPIVAVSILPQEYFVKRIAGNLVDIVVLVGEGQSPHSYEPTPNQMALLAQAKAWVLSGTDFEIALEPKIRALYPNLSIVDGTEGVTYRMLESHSHEGEEAHTEGEDHTEEESGIDRHTWLGKEPAILIANHVKDMLLSILPDKKELIETNWKQLVVDIQTEFDGLTQSLASLKGRTVFVYHPAFGYFFDEFGISQESVETGGKEPTAKALAALISEARADNAVAIFVQTQFPVVAAKTVADAIGAKVVALDPLAADWLANIHLMGEALKASVY